MQKLDLTLKGHNLLFARALAREEICKEPKAEPCVVHASPLKAVKAETVVVLGSPIKAEPCANNPIVHTASPKHEVIDLTAEEDYATFPLTQVCQARVGCNDEQQQRV